MWIKHEGALRNLDNIVELSPSKTETEIVVYSAYEENYGHDVMKFSTPDQRDSAMQRIRDGIEQGRAIVDLEDLE